MQRGKKAIEILKKPILHMNFKGSFRLGCGMVSSKERVMVDDTLFNSKDNDETCTDDKLIDNIKKFIRSYILNITDNSNVYKLLNNNKQELTSTAFSLSSDSA